MIDVHVLAFHRSLLALQVPYNMERILHILSGGDVQLVCRVQNEFESSGKTKIPDDILQKVNAEKNHSL